MYMFRLMIYEEEDFEGHYKNFHQTRLYFSFVFPFFHDSLSLTKRGEETIWEKLFRSGLKPICTMFFFIVMIINL